MASPRAVRSTRIEIAGFVADEIGRARGRRPRPGRGATSPTVRLVPSGFERRTMPGDLVGAALLHAGAHAGIGAASTSPAGSASTSRADGVGDLAQGHVVGDQVRGRHLDHGLRRGDAADRGARDALLEQPRTKSSANRASWSGATGPVMTTSVTRSHQSPRPTSGSSASSGRSVTPSTAGCTSAAARAMSQPGSNSSSIRARPSRARGLGSRSRRRPPAARAPAAARWRCRHPRRPRRPSATSTSISSMHHVGKELRAHVRDGASAPAATISTSSRFASGPVAGEVAEDAARAEPERLRRHR